MKNSRLATAVFAAAAAAALACAGFAGCSGGKKADSRGDDSAQWVLDYANELSSKGLHQRAAQAYEDYLAANPEPGPKNANISRMVGDIYMDGLNDCESAIASFIRVKHLDPDRAEDEEMSERMVECLERTGRGRDAQLLLEEKSLLGGKSKEEKLDTSPVVAQIGERYITSDALNREIKNRGLKPEDLKGPQKLDILRDCLAKELMAGAARRKGYDRSDQAKSLIDAASREILSRMIYQEEVSEKAKVQPYSAKNVYDANPDRFKAEGEDEPKPFEEVKDQIEAELRAQQEQGLYRGLIDRMMKAEQVHIYEDLF